MHIPYTDACFIFLLLILSGCATNTEGCQPLIADGFELRQREARPDLVELYAVKHRIYEDLKRRRNGRLEDCPVIYQNDSDSKFVPGFSGEENNTFGGSSNRAQDKVDWENAQSDAVNRVLGDGGEATPASKAPSQPETSPSPEPVHEKEIPTIYELRDEYVSFQVTDLVEPDFFYIDLASPTQKTATLELTGTGNIELKSGRKFEGYPIDIKYFLANDRDGWRCVHAHAVFDPDYVKPGGPSPKSFFKIGW